MPEDPDEQTLAEAFDEAQRTLEMLCVWSDHTDNKLIVVFAISSLIASLVPAFYQIDAHGLRLAFWILSLCAWFVAASACFEAFRLREFAFGPSPRDLANPRWHTQTVAEYYRRRLAEMADWLERCHIQCRQKTRRLEVAIGAAVVEVLFLAIALML